MAMDDRDSIHVDEAEAVGAEETREVLGEPSDLQPGEALERLRRGETIRDLRIVGLRLKGTFPLPVRMERVELVNANFGGGEFLDEVAIERCKLVRPSCGNGARFDKGFSLRGSMIIKGHFANLCVKGPWRCDNVRVSGPLFVINGRFEDKVRFWEARFEGWVDFKGCTFVGEADLRSFHAEEGFKLLGCRFERDALFRGATVCKKWDAEGSRFERLLDLSKVKFHDFAYLEAIETGPEHRIAFHNAVIERVLIRADQVEGKLLSEQSGDHERAMHEYGLLKRVFEGLHRYEQEDWAFYRFKVNQRRSRPRSWRRPWSKFSQMMDWLFLDLGCGYGTNPFRAVRMSGLLMLAFGLIYMADVSALPVDRRPFDSLDVTHPLNRVMIGLLTSVSVFTSGFGSLRDAAQGWMNIPMIVESLLGTLIWGLFIVAFSRKVIR
jgi:hypothetical protein